MSIVLITDGWLAPVQVIKTITAPSGAKGDLLPPPRPPCGAVGTTPRKKKK